MSAEKPNLPNALQMIWGIALVLAGVGVFVRIPQVMPKLAQFGNFASATWFIRFCFYLMGIILIGGGAKKIVRYFKAQRSMPLEKPVNPPADPIDPADR